MKLTILGPPGAGKGTQAMMISQHYGIPKLSTGDILRDEVARGTPLGKKVKEYLDKGILVPDDLLIELVSRKISGLESYVLDGYPRTLRQAESVQECLAILIEVDDDEIVDRLSGRRMCRCGASYHIKYYPPKRDEICDVCGAKLYQRNDDREEVIRERLRIYREQTMPVIKFYEDRGMLRRVDGSGSKDEVFRMIKDVVDSHFHTDG